MTDFLPPQPRLYTVEAHGRPVVVLSVPGAEAPEDTMLADPKFAQLLRETEKNIRNLADAKKERGFDLDEVMAIREIDEALDTYLGEDLKTLEGADWPGRPLWDGNEKNIHVRPATDNEIEEWKRSLQSAMERGEEDPGEMDWLAFLVPTRDLSENPDCC